MNAQQDAKKPLVKILGVGGAGGNLIHCLQGTDLAAVPALAVHANPRVFDLWTHPNRLLLGAGTAAAGDAEVGRRAAVAGLAAVEEFCAGADVVIILAGLGRGTGGGASPVFAKAARASGAFVLCLVTEPFDLEGPHRQARAQTALAALRAEADAVISIPNERLKSVIDPKTPPTEWSKLINHVLGQGLLGIWRMMVNPGLARIDFDCFRTVLRGCESGVAFATVETRGEHRVREIAAKLSASPMLADGQILTQAREVLACLVWGPDLAMEDVNQIVDLLGRLVPDGRVIPSAVQDARFAGRLSLTVLTSCRTPDLSSPLPASKTSLPQPKAVEMATDDHPDFDTNFFTKSTVPPQPPTPAIPAPEVAAQAPSEPVPESSDAAEEPSQPTAARRVDASGSKSFKPKQQFFNFETVSIELFRGTEPTVFQGENLDEPTYHRRGVPFN